MTSPKVEKQDKPETFEHMITVLMIMFGDAREHEYNLSIVTEDKDRLEKSEKIIREAYEYARSWFEEYKQLSHPGRQE